MIDGSAYVILGALFLILIVLITVVIFVSKKKEQISETVSHLSSPKKSISSRDPFSYEQINDGTPLADEIPKSKVVKRRTQKRADEKTQKTVSNAHADILFDEKLPDSVQTWKPLKPVVQSHREHSTVIQAAAKGFLLREKVHKDIARCITACAIAKGYIERSKYEQEHEKFVLYRIEGHQVEQMRKEEKEKELKQLQDMKRQEEEKLIQQQEIEKTPELRQLEEIKRQEQEKARLEQAHRELQERIKKGKEKSDKIRLERKVKEEEKKRKLEEDEIARKKRKEALNKRRKEKEQQIEAQLSEELPLQEEIKAPTTEIDLSEFEKDLAYDTAYQIHFRIDPTQVLTLLPEEHKLTIDTLSVGKAQQWTFNEGGYVTSVKHPNLVLEIRNNVIQAGEKMIVDPSKRLSEDDDVINQTFDVVHSGFKEQETKFIRLTSNIKMILGQSVKVPGKLVLHVLNRETGMKNSWVFKALQK